MRLTASPLECRQAIELMSDFLDGALSRRERRRLERHLAACDACTTYLEQLRVTIATTGRAVPDDLEPEALDELVEIFRRFRAQGEGDGTAETSEP